MNNPGAVRAICLDWGDTLMADEGPAGVPMADWPEVRVLPQVADVLAALAPRYPLYVASNAADSTQADIERALSRGGLRHFFSGVFCQRSLGWHKTQPEFWAAICAQLGRLPGEVLMVGDGLEQDVRAPLGAGLQALWLRPAGAPEAADVVALDSLAQLPRWLDQIDSSRASASATRTVSRR